MTLSEPRFVIRTLVAGFVAALSIAAGVYVGFAQSIRTSQAVTPESFRNDSYLEIGDPLPNIVVSLAADGQPTSLTALLRGRRGMLLFVSATCGACDALFNYWNRRVMGSLPEDIELICVYDADDPDQYKTAAGKEQLHGATVVTMQRSLIKTRTGIAVTPTTVGVSKNGTIAFIASGMDKRLTAELADAIL